jgi:pimeloyl-ACP methyl ester carboxylesterase
MRFLHTGLERLGYSVISVELPITRGNIGAGAAALEEQLKREQLRDRHVAFVAHSMGGLVVRTLIAQSMQNDTPPFKFSHCIFIGTPHQGTPLADLALHVPGVGRFFKALSDLRTRPAGTWSAPLLHSGAGKVAIQGAQIRIGIIAGTSASFLPGRFLIPGDNDGMVPHTSAIAPDADAIMLLPFNHVTIHKREVTLGAVAHFLAYGQFLPEI